MDLVEVYFRDFVDRRFGSVIMSRQEVRDMQKFRLMDKLTCVQCGSTSYQPSVGKSSRSFMVQCDPECEGNVKEVKDVPKADEPGRKPK